MAGQSPRLRTLETHLSQIERIDKRVDHANRVALELILSSDAWAREHGLDPPARYVLYIDQGEELYTRAEACSRARFVEILSEAARHERVRILMSLRADFLWSFAERCRAISGNG